MAETQLASANVVSKWRSDYYKEYVRGTGLEPYMGGSKNNIIRIFKDLLNEAGKTINVPLITALRGGQVTGSQTLSGNEDDLGNYNDAITVDWARSGVVVTKAQSAYTGINLWNAAKDANKEKSTRFLKRDLIDAFGSIIIPGAALTNGNAADTAVLYANSTAGQRNTHLTNNSDRTLFGSLVANGSSNVWATALATVDSTNDRLSVAVANLAKRMAENTGPDASGGVSVNTRPSITPYSTRDGVYSGFIMFCAPNSFRDLAADSAMIAANRDARPRDVEKNPIFQDGDLIYNGTIFRKLPELSRLTLSAVGASSINVDRNFLCGQSAISLGWGQMPKPTEKKEDDYGFKPGTGIEELRGQKKTSYLGTQYGCVEVLTASVDDA